MPGWWGGGREERASGAEGLDPSLPRCSQEGLGAILCSGRERGELRHSHCAA